jgi:HTH-type transcriptional regulator / antitoxin HipB
MTSGISQRIHTPVDLGLVIRERRRALALDQRTLAARIGVSRQWLVEVEQGKTRAGIGLLLSTLRALGLETRVTTSEGSPAATSAKVALDAIDIDAIVDKARGSTSVHEPLAITPRKPRAQSASVRRATTPKGNSSRPRQRPAKRP